MSRAGVVIVSKDAYFKSVKLTRFAEMFTEVV